MNEHDKANLQFILSASKETLKDWYESLSEDDAVYAEELLARAKTEVMMRIVELNDSVVDVSDANDLLARYRL